MILARIDADTARSASALWPLLRIPLDLDRSASKPFRRPQDWLVTDSGQSGHHRHGRARQRAIRWWSGHVDGPQGSPHVLF